MKNYRFLEFKLLIWTDIIFYSGLALVCLATGYPLEKAFLYGSIFVFSGLAVCLISSLLKNKSDQFIFPLANFLMSLGLLVILHLRSDLYFKQILWIVIGIIFYILIIIFLKDFRTLENYKYVSVFIGLILQAALIFAGTEINNVKLWFNLGYFYFQPSEIVKILLVIFLAGYLASYKDFFSQRVKSLKYFLPLIFMWLATMAVLVFQKDLGTALLFFSIFLTLFYLATLRKDFLFTGIILFIFGVFICYKIFPHIQLRFAAWLNPWKDASGSGYQIIQGLFALTAGGFWGVGLGKGLSSYIPAAHTDFVFNSLTEELGLAGAAAVIIGFLFLLQRFFKTASETKDVFGSLLALGLAFALAWQTIIILCGNLKIIPLTGVTLPFVSYGGSSVVANLIILALLNKISDKRQE